jgi:ABC-type amino acid transport substrate-binding protein
MRALFVTLMLLAAIPAHAQAVLDGIIARGTLKVGLTGDYKPFSIKDGAGTFEGLDVDMAASLAKALGVKLEIVPTSWPTLMSGLQSGAYDIAMGGITVTTDRAKTALFSTPVLKSGKTPIARCADKAKYNTIADIDKPGVRVIFNPGQPVARDAGGVPEQRDDLPGDRRRPRRRDGDRRRRDAAAAEAAPRAVRHPSRRTIRPLRAGLHAAA